jgi:hypothetical protein
MKLKCLTKRCGWVGEEKEREQLRFSEGEKLTIRDVCPRCHGEIFYPLPLELKRVGNGLKQAIYR